jgi:hydroxymethylglutaryl-CoA reductase
MTIEDRIKVVNNKVNDKINPNTLLKGGLDLSTADSMTENVIGLLSLPLSVVPEFRINNKNYMIPMCIE